MRLSALPEDLFDVTGEGLYGAYQTGAQVDVGREGLYGGFD
jgi:hypothetical protein